MSVDPGSFGRESCLFFELGVMRGIGYGVGLLLCITAPLR